jgi:hypothetical protein
MFWEKIETAIKKVGSLLFGISDLIGHILTNLQKGYKILFLLSIVWIAFRYGGSEFGTIIIAIKGLSDTVEKWIKKTDDP